MIRVLFIILLLLTCSLESKAILSDDYTSLDAEFIEPPEKLLPALNARVNFSFKDTKLSQILLLLAKVGEFNIVMPNKYDKEITIVINEQRVKDAIADVCKLAEVNYEFKGSSLVIYKSDISGLDFAALPVAYFKANSFADHLNQHLFHQIIVTQDMNNLRPYAVADPAKNSVVVFGSEEHIKAATRFVEEMDIAPKVKIYTPKNLSTKEIRKILQVYFSDNFLIDIKRIEENDLLIKGSSKVVDEAVKLISSLDKPLTNITMLMEVYVIKNNHEDIFKHSFGTDIANHLGKHFQNSNNTNIDLLSLFDKKDTLILELQNSIPVQALGLSIIGERSIIDPDKVAITVFNETLSGVIDQNSVFKVLTEDDLKTYKDFKNFITKKNGTVLLNFKIEN